MEKSDREGITSGILQDAKKWVASANPDWFDGMVIAETEANTLEAAQLVAMRDLPTRKVELLRAATEVGRMGLRLREIRLSIAPRDIDRALEGMRAAAAEAEECAAAACLVPAAAGTADSTSADRILHAAEWAAAACSGPA